MSREECAALKAMPNTRYPTALRNRVILEVMHRAGLRISEVCKLRRRDIIWERGQLEVRAGKGNKDRTVTTDPATMAWLSAWDSRRPRGAFFFNTLKGTQLCTRYIGQMVRRMADRAVKRGKINADRAARITPHKLRHAHATELIEEGAALTAIQQQLGHANIAATSVYLHARPDALIDHMAGRPPDLPTPAPQDP
jgi:integrase/recombinase XerD